MTPDTRDEWKNPRLARNAFLWPALLVILVLAIFPLLASLRLAMSPFRLAQGGFEPQFVGLTNFSNLFFGADKNHYLGLFRAPTAVGWVVFLGGTALA